MAITGTGKTSVAPHGAMFAFRYTEDFTKTESEVVLAGGGPWKKKRGDAYMDAYVAALRKRRHEQLERKVDQIVAQAKPGDVDSQNETAARLAKIIGATDRAQAILEQVDAEMETWEKKRQARRKRDQVAALMLH